MTRIEWFLSGLLVVLLLIVAGIAVLFWLQPDSQARSNEAVAIAPTSTFFGQTAQVVHAIGQNMAQAWQPDAQLQKASATWPQGTDHAELRKGEATWSLTFYSPATQSIAVISVREGVATQTATNTVAQPLTLQDISGWKLNSDEAIQRLLDQGGTLFMNQNGVSTLTVALTTSGEGGRIEWLLSLFAPQSSESFTMRLDASSGEVLELMDTTVLDN